MKKNQFLLLFAVFVLCLDATAQTVMWSVRPEGFADKQTLFRSGDKVGLLNSQGQQVLSAQYDSITPFHGGYALALQNVGRRGQIKAIIREGDYDVTEVAEELYANKYSYFSEGKMCVSNATRQQGFLSTDGNLVIPCQYKTVHPFFEGLASVTYQSDNGKENVYYINESMNEISVEPGYGEVIFGSSFVNGQAVVFTINRKGYVINRNGRTLGRYHYSVEDAYQAARKSAEYALAERNTPLRQEQTVELSDDSGYTVYEEGGKYGYMTTGGKIVIPAQFQKAEPFRGGYANVVLGNKTGVLRLIENGSFSGNMEKNLLKVGSNGKAEKASYALSVPEGLKDANIVLRVFDEKGVEQKNVVAHSASGTSRSFEFFPEIAAGQSAGHYDLYVGTSDGLLLWSNRADLAFEHTKESIEHHDNLVAQRKPAGKPRFKVAPPKNPRKKADQNDNFPISVTITNTGDANGMVTVTLRVNNQDVGRQRVNVKAGSSSQATISFKVKKERLAALVEAILDNGTKSESHIDLKAFY